MDLHLVCQSRNFELEDIKHAVKAKKVQVRVNEDPLSQMVRESANDRADSEQVEEAVDDKVAASITNKLGQADPLADFHKLEVQMLARNEFETWEQKKLKIFATFSKKTDGREIVIDERRDRDTDRVIRMGKGKSRMDQLE